MMTYTDPSIAFADAYRNVSSRLHEIPFITAYETYVKVRESAKRNRVETFSLDERCLALITHWSLIAVYFVASVDHALIKIGKTADLNRRFASLVNMSPAPLEVAYVVEYDVGLEKRIHQHLEDHRAHGEWFHASAEVVDFIRGVKNNGHRWMIEQVGDADHNWIAYRRAHERKQSEWRTYMKSGMRKRDIENAKASVAEFRRKVAQMAIDSN